MCLVLSRRVEEEIVFDFQKVIELIDNEQFDEAIEALRSISVIVTDVRGDRVSLGIDAHESIGVFRLEVLKEIEAERLAAARLITSPERRAYAKAKHRCTNPEAQGYHHYGGRGIEFRFESFREFVDHLGPRPTRGYSLDRIDNSGHYEPGNVRWASIRQQVNNKRNNRRLQHDGFDLTIAQWSRKTGIPTKTLSERIDAGWTIEESLTRPVEARRLLTRNEAFYIHKLSIDGLSKREIAEELGVCVATVGNVLKGKTFKDVFAEVQNEIDAEAAS